MYRKEIRLIPRPLVDDILLSISNLMEKNLRMFHRSGHYDMPQIKGKGSGKCVPMFESEK